MLTIKNQIEKIREKFIREKFAVGLDIGTSAIKLVILKFIMGTVEISDFGIEPVENDLEAALKKIVKAHNISRVNIAVSGLSTLSRYVNFPRMNNEELRQCLKFEAQKHIPFSVEEVSLDGSILKMDLPDNQMLVMLAAVKNEFINQRLKLIEGAGLKANIVDVDSIALINAFNFNYGQEESLKDKTIALLNIGAAFSNLTILDRNIPYLSRDISIAGVKFTQKIADTLGLDFKTAEGLKVNPDKERIDKVASAIESALNELINEIRTSFDYFENQTPSSVTKVFLSGQGAAFAGLKDMLANLLGIEVEYWDPLKRINIAKGIEPEKIRMLSVQLAVALGLALRK